MLLLERILFCRLHQPLLHKRCKRSEVHAVPRKPTHLCWQLPAKLELRGESRDIGSGIPCCKNEVRHIGPYQRYQSADIIVGPIDRSVGRSAGPLGEHLAGLLRDADEGGSPAQLLELGGAHVGTGGAEAPQHVPDGVLHVSPVGNLHRPPFGRPERRQRVTHSQEGV